MSARIEIYRNYYEFFNNEIKAINADIRKINKQLLAEDNDCCIKKLKSILTCLDKEKTKVQEKVNHYKELMEDQDEIHI